MANPLDKQLERWVSAGVVDAATAARIRTLEQSQGSSERLRWPVLLAVALGGLLLCAGVLLFVAAHWDELSPAWRFTLVLVLVAVFPIAGAMTEERFPPLSTTFYTIGTICVGAGIFLTAQVFHLQEHWPSGMLMWTIGALAAWLLLGHWTQAALLALLVPAWLAGCWGLGHPASRLGTPWQPVDICVEFAWALLLGRSRSARHGGLGIARAAERAHQPVCRGVCFDGDHFLFLGRHG